MTRIATGSLNWSVYGERKWSDFVTRGIVNITKHIIPAYIIYTYIIYKCNALYLKYEHEGACVALLYTPSEKNI